MGDPPGAASEDWTFEAGRPPQWLRSGELRSREDVVRGHVGDFPDVLLRLFRGENTGKLVLALEGEQ